MKILHVTNYYHEKSGYDEKCIAQKQKELGHDVLVVTSDYYFPFPNYNQTMQQCFGDRHVGDGVFFDGNVRVIRRKSSFSSTGRPGIIYFSIGRILDEFWPDIVHVHGATNMTLPALCLRQKRFKYKIFVDSHQDDSVSNFNESPADRIYYGIWRFFYHSLGFKKHISQFLPITGNATTWLAKRLNISESQMTLSPLGVDLETMSYDSESERKFRTHHGIGDKLIVVNAGKQYPEKRIDWIIDVYKAALELGANAFLVLVGNADDEYDAFLREKLIDIEGKYLRLPFLEREELKSVYSAADIGIWPGVPSITIQEAMACGVSVILPDNNIVGHLVINNGLHESGDVMNTAAFINELSMNPDKLDLMKTESVTLVHKYDWQSISSDLLLLYSESVD